MTWMVGNFERTLSGAVLLALVTLTSAAPADAVEIKGTVVAVTGTDVRITVEGDSLPQVGDEVKISFRIPGGPELNVGTWRVSRVEADLVAATVVEATGKPAVDQIATIASANPTRRGALGTTPSAGESQKTPDTPGLGASAPTARTPLPWVPGASAPKPFARPVNITRNQLPVGPMRLGEGRFERVGPAFVINSSTGYDTFEAVSTQPAREFYAAVRIRVERGTGPAAVAGIIFNADGFMYPHDSDVFFGKDDRAGLLLAQYQGGTWVNIPVPSPPSTPVRAGDIDWFEVIRHGGRYEFKLNGSRIATLNAPSSPTQWTMVYADQGNRAEFYDWQVERPE